MKLCPNCGLSRKECGQSIVGEARTWIDTKYIPGARLKKIGCDCATLLMEVLKTTHHLTQEEVVDYSGDWFAHTGEERYMKRLFRHGYKVILNIGHRTLRPLPGSIVLTKAVRSHVFNHAGIVTTWPKIIHAISPRVAEVSALYDPMWAAHEIATFDLWPEEQS